MTYESTRTLQSAVCPGVCFTVCRISFGRRLELLRQIRAIGQRLEFEQAGDSVEDRLSAAVSSAEIDKLYLRWGLRGIEGLTIDGKPATPDTLCEDGPEGLCREIVAAIRHECGLTEEERKN